MDLSLINNELKNCGVKGYFFVRQKRIPMTICQGVSIGVDKSSNIPCLYDSNINKYVSEAFVNGNDSGFTSLGSNIIESNITEGSGLLSVEAQIIPEIQSKLNGSEMFLQKT
jgi:hypothetical protein